MLKGRLRDYSGKMGREIADIVISGTLKLAEQKRTSIATARAASDLFDIELKSYIKCVTAFLLESAPAG